MPLALKNKGCLYMSSYSMHPKDQESYWARSVSSPKMHSGAIYAGVLLTLILESLGWLKPKSQSFALNSASTRILLGFKSRCQNPCSWSCFNPKEIPKAIFYIWPKAIFWVFYNLYKSQSINSVATIKGKTPSCLQWKTPW